jgi:hypothetical protein
MPVMNRLFIPILLLSVLVSGALSAQDAREPGVNINVNADFASQYLWRGLVFGKGPAVQPYGSISYRGFEFGTWGSYEFAGTFKEVDMTAKYTVKDFSVVFLDMFFPGLEGTNQNYFNFRNSTTGHCAELGLSFNGTSRLPLSVYAGMIIYGVSVDPVPSDAEKLNHSTYFEFKYSHTVKDYACSVFAGLTPSPSNLYQTGGFSVFNLGASAQKAIKINETFSVPVKLTLSANPAIEKMYLTLILTI